MRSDDVLLALFRAGNEDAFRVIHDRYRQRLFAYTRQMLPGSSQDAEDALQDVFVRAYSGLRATNRPLAVRPWLYRVAHNRCVDELRRPLPPPPAVLQEVCAPPRDPIAQVEQRESLRRLISDLRRLPAQQRSALLMRELGGMSYAEVATAMDVSVPAVKSLLVRARIGLTLAAEARNTACVEICEEITVAHDRGVRSSGTVRRHVADCGGCRQYQSSLRKSRRQFAALAPVGPIGVLAKMLGIGGGGAAGGGAAATGGATATTGAVLSGGAGASVGGFAAGAGHVATLIAAAVVTAGGAVAVQHSITPVHHRSVVHESAYIAPRASSGVIAAPYQSQPYAAPPAAPSTAAGPTKEPVSKSTTTTSGGTTSTAAAPASVSGGDNIVPTASPTSATNNPSGTGATGASTGSANPTGTGGTSGATTSTGPPGSTGTSSSSGTGTNGINATGTGSTTPPGGSGPTAPPATGTGATTGTGSAPTTGSPPGP